MRTLSRTRIVPSHLHDRLAQPHPREGQPHWASFNRSPAYSFRKFDTETRQKESCPFHDLRAEGQFQPEIYCIGSGNARPDPNFLLRKEGPRMKCSLSTGPHIGAGGGLIPYDTTPAPPALRPKTDRPWATSKKGGLFGTHLYEPTGVAAEQPRAPPASKQHFQAGKVPQKMAPYEHMADGHFVDEKKKPFRLLCGRGPGLFDRHLYKGSRQVSPAETKVTRPTFIPPVQAKRHHGNTFGRYPPYMPNQAPEDNMPRKPAKRQLKPIYTWATKTKRAMPIRYACTANTRPHPRLCATHSSTWTVTKVGE